MAGARALWRANGMKDGNLDKPIVAMVNSFTQFVPGHVHLKDLGQMDVREIEAAGGIAKEFNTIAVDDGIAIGHGGMLYSLPSSELIADSVEYMVNAHCADAMVCISNCDKIIEKAIPGQISSTKKSSKLIWSMRWSRRAIALSAMVIELKLNMLLVQRAVLVSACLWLIL